MIKFPYEEEHSHILGLIRRPIAKVNFWSKKFSRWLEFSMIVDTGADYCLFPRSNAFDLGIDLEKDCMLFQTFGIGGSENIYFLKRIKMRIGREVLFVSVGFLRRDDLPPLLGRFKCLNRFDMRFSNYITTFIKLRRE